MRFKNCYIGVLQKLNTDFFMIYGHDTSEKLSLTSSSEKKRSSRVGLGLWGHKSPNKAKIHNFAIPKSCSLATSLAAGRILFRQKNRDGNSHLLSPKIEILPIFMKINPWPLIVYDIDYLIPRLSDATQEFHLVWKLF